MKQQPLYIGADHAGFQLKEELKRYLDRRHIAYKDLGNMQYDPHDDYPDFGFAVGEAVVKNKSRGILVCGSSYGVCIAANKVKGVRAVSINTVRDAQLAREHNDANVLCLSGWNLSPAAMKRLVGAFLRTQPSRAQRHQRRIGKIALYEKTKHKR